MSQRDEKEVDSILAREKKALTKLEGRRILNIDRMHKLRNANEKIELLIEKLTGVPFEKPKVVVERGSGTGGEAIGMSANEKS